MMLSPGLRFILVSFIPAVFGPPLVVHGLLLLFRSTLSTNSGLLFLVYAFSSVIHYYAVGALVYAKEILGARRLHARILPRVRGYLPGNIDLVIKGITAGKTGYIGEPWIQIFKSSRGESSCSLEILGDDRTLTRNPRNIQKILAVDFDNYCKGEFFGSISEPLLGVGVFNSDGDRWQFHRKLARPFFSKERVTDLLIYDRKAASIIQKMQEQLDNNIPIDFQDLVGRFTLDSAAEFLLGVSTDSIDAPLPVPHNFPESPQKKIIVATASTRFAKTFAQAQVTLLNRLDLGYLWPLGEMWGDKMKKPMDEVRNFITTIVRNAKGKYDNGGSEEANTLLSHLLSVTDDMKIIVDQTLNILLAGRDTTASLLTFTTYCLAMHPEVLSCLRKEILDTIGNHRAPTYDDIRGMKYLRAVLNETLRLYPPVPFNIRETIKETVWYGEDGGKLYVPGRTRVVYSTLHLQRDEKYWGPDAHLFDPDRWLDSRVSNYTSNPFIYIPFNAGPRICLGQQFALHEASYFMIRLLQRFDHFELVPEYQPPGTCPPEHWKDPATLAPLAKRQALEQCFVRSHLTLYADGGLWLRARRVKS